MSLFPPAARRVAWFLLAVWALAAPAAAQSNGPVRRLSIDEAVELALEQNLGVQIERLNPQISDLSVAQADTAWTPSVSTTFTTNERDTPANSFLSGAADKITSGQISTAVNYSQAFRWGGNAAVAWDNSRSTSNNIFSNFDPTLQANLSLQYSQPLLRNRTIDASRQQLLVAQKNREISDVQLQQTIATTRRNVRNAYWDLAYAVATRDVASQSLDLAQQSLRNTRARVEIGTMAPIDIVEASAEVARRQEALIVAEASIEQAEDRLRALVLDPSMPDFWSTRIELTDVRALQSAPIDLDAAVRNALNLRTDLRQAQKSLESSDISIRYARNQTLPDLNVQVNYGVTGLGGKQFLRGQPVGGSFIGPVIGEVSRGNGSVLGNLFTNDYPTWTLALTVGYPIGLANAEANLARTRLERRQSEVQLQNLELQVTTQVRDAARQVTTNAQRVETTRVARELSEERLGAEEKKLAAGTSTSFFVFQAQRDLAEARNSELRAVLDYNKSLVDFETVQETSLGGGTGTIAVPTAGTAATTGGGTATTATAQGAGQGQGQGF